MEDLLFKDSYGMELKPADVVREVVEYMKAAPSYSYKVIIGTDSEMLEENGADFVTAIVVHRVGNGGRYFWRQINDGKFFTMRDRIIHEVMLSLDIAKAILENFQEALRGMKWDFEIHADVGQNGPTSTLIQEVTGIIRANNFTAKTKPESYAASSVADRHC